MTWITTACQRLNSKHLSSEILTSLPTSQVSLLSPWCFTYFYFRHHASIHVHVYVSLSIYSYKCFQCSLILSYIRISTVMVCLFTVLCSTSSWSKTNFELLSGSGFNRPTIFSLYEILFIQTHLTLSFSLFLLSTLIDCSLCIQPPSLYSAFHF